MDESKWERYAALGGIWFVVLTVVGSLLAGAPPSTDDSAAKIAKYFADHSGALEVGLFINGLGLVGLFWWFGSLWRLMVKAEDGRPRMAVVALGGLAVGGAMALASGAVTSAVALQHKDVAGGAKFFYILSLVLIACAGFGVLIHVAAVTSLSYRTKLFAPWINVIGWIVALLFLVGAIGTASDAPVLGFIGLFGFLSWCVWIVVVSLNMWRRTAAAAT